MTPQCRNTWEFICVKNCVSWSAYVGLNNGNVNVSDCEWVFLISCRHLQRFWGASGDFWQAQWDRLLDVIGEDSFTFWVYGKDKLRMM